MDSWVKIQDANQSTLEASTYDKRGIREEKPGGIFKRQARFANHRRDCKTYDDATAILTVEAGGASDTLSICIEEMFETSNGSISSSQMSVSLTRKNINALRDILDKHDAEREAETEAAA